MGRLDEVHLLTGLKTFRLLIPVGDPEMLIATVKIGQIGHFFKMAPCGANQGNIYVLIFLHRFYDRANDFHFSVSPGKNHYM